MRTPTAIFALIAIATAISAIKYFMTKEEDRPSILVNSMLYFPLFLGIAAILINGGSNQVTVVNGTSSSECISKKHFLFYNAHSAAKGSNIVFMAPYGKDVIFNNTNRNLVCYPIKYGNVKGNEVPVHIPAHTIRKVEEKPSYFFRAVPDKIMYTSRYASSGKTKWVLLADDQELESEEAYKWLNSYSK